MKSYKIKNKDGAAQLRRCFGMGVGRGAGACPHVLVFGFWNIPHGLNLCDLETGTEVFSPSIVVCRVRILCARGLRDDVFALSTTLSRLAIRLFRHNIRQHDHGRGVCPLLCCELFGPYGRHRD